MVAKRLVFFRLKIWVDMMLFTLNLKPYEIMVRSSSANIQASVTVEVDPAGNFKSVKGGGTRVIGVFYSNQELKDTDKTKP
jgi:hypothetical protein